MNRMEQARLLYTLLDAADDEQRLHDPVLAEKWRALKASFDNAHCEQYYDALEALLDELDRQGALTGTWIHARWLAAKARRESTPDLRRESRLGRGYRFVER